MRLLPTCALLLSLSALPGFAQSSNVSDTHTVLPANANDSSVDYSALREKLASQNKVLTDQVNSQRAIVKKNQILLKDAQKLDASNKKLGERRRSLRRKTLTLKSKRMALKSSQAPMQTAAIQ